MRTRHVLLGAAMTAVIPLAVPAASSAARPDVFRPEPAAYPFSIDDCGFEIEITGVGRTGAIFFDSGRAHFFSPGLRGVLRNTETGATLPLVSTGSFHDGAAVDGRPGYIVEYPTTGVGHNLLFGEFVDDDGAVTAGVYAVVGRITATIGIPEDGDAIRFFDLDTSRAQVVDVCAALG